MNSRKKVSEKVLIAILFAVLCVVTLMLAAAIGFDLWIYTASVNGDANNKWMIGIWKICDASPSDSLMTLYSSTNENCTNIGNLTAIQQVIREQGWQQDIYLVSLVCVFLSTAFILLSHMFFFCAYLPLSRCKTIGQGGLPSVLFTSGVCQVCSLVTGFFISNSDDLQFGVSYYLVIASVAPTWIIAVVILVTMCRTS